MKRDDVISPIQLVRNTLESKSKNDPTQLEREKEGVGGLSSRVWDRLTLLVARTPKFNSV